MSSENLIGQTLDAKYKIESEIGKGGMGTVYLSTHVGTERPVAVKVIAPQFMQRAEFVERFRREARAAGRLRHPNVVNVTDFGFSETASGRVAYLVMEYLDGCTLGEILDEEKRLPLAWSLDILEQVCSAVEEAHRQGIIHRDLKPDNIWLEPDGRGGYTVKVLDFGIAKLESDPADSFQIENAALESAREARQTQQIPLGATVTDRTSAPTVNARKNETVVSEKATLIENGRPKTHAAESRTLIQPAKINLEGGTLIQPAAEINLEGGTMLQPAPETDTEGGTLIQPAAIDTEGGTAILSTSETKILENERQETKLLSAQIETREGNAAKRNTSELTRVGAVLGTPLYMSPEQCRGERLTACSDIYSLGVIAYQMVSGKPPFTGEFAEVMNAHKETAPPPLEAKNVSARVKKVIFSALDKDTAMRPPSAAAFASELRAQSEGVWKLLSRALVVYSENVGKFLLLAFVIYLPMELVFVAQTTVAILAETGVTGEMTVLRVALTVIYSLMSFFSGTLLTGLITWLVAQKMAVPMRPLHLRPAFRALRKRLKTLLGTAAFSTIMGFIGFLFCLLPGLVMFICWSLVTPVVMMEGLRGRRAFARSYQLVKRNLKTTVAVILLSLFCGFAASGFAQILSRGILGDALKTAPPAAQSDQNINVKIGQGIQIENNQIDRKNETEEQKRERRLKGTIRESAFATIQLPILTVIGSFFAVVTALLYIKTRMAGGESTSDLLEQFEETDQPRKKWQERVRGRLLQSGRMTSKGGG